jgi:pilus assembly protein Flp/PilA
MIAMVDKFWADGTGAIGDGLIVAGIALAVIAVLNGAGSRLNGKFMSINHSSKQARRHS